MSFEVGDRVDVGGLRGWVESVSLSGWPVVAFDIFGPPTFTGEADSRQGLPQNPALVTRLSVVDYLAELA